MSGRIAVVGAGIAGLSAARRLARAGREVAIFDKARGLGGRTSTRRRESDAFDHGAQYFTCRGDEFKHQVTDWCSRGVAGVWHASVRSLGGDAPRERAERIRYVGVPGMSALARDLAAELEVARTQRIESIEGDARDWRLRVETGECRGPYDAVVVATPAPQAVPLLVAFPEFANRAGSVAMHPCHAVMVKFARRLDVDFDAAFVSDSPLSWVARNSSKPGRPGEDCWVLHSSPSWSSAHVDESGEKVEKEMLQALSEALSGELPPIAFQTSHRWLLARPVEPLGVPFLWDADAGVGVCGDWLHGDRVEDAFTSGERLASAILG